MEMSAISTVYQIWDLGSKGSFSLTFDPIVLSVAS